jgi:S-adenosylmethionine synthetase
MIKKYFTSESVTEGHPDKICDQIADAILDEILKSDPSARVACEVTAATGLITIMGEITTEAYVDFDKITRDTIREIGYISSDLGFDANTCGVINCIHEQSPDIAMGVDHSLESKSGLIDELDNGAGDQGMMFGFACDETPELMPMPIILAHKLTKQLSLVRKNGTLPYLRPDGKSQVTIEYDDNNTPKRVYTIVISSQHSDNISMDKLRNDIINNVIYKVIPENLIDSNTKMFINPSGRFVIGGPCGDTGLTGRKIIVDTYGGYSRHGGGAFSGKDSTKVDRSAGYMARYIAKNIVAAKLAKKCEIQVSYAIGVANPTSLFIETFGTETIPIEEITSKVIRNFDLRPSAIIKKLNLRTPIFKQTAAYGHFGRNDLNLPWERTDMVDALTRKAD